MLARLEGLRPERNEEWVEVARVRQLKLKEKTTGSITNEQKTWTQEMAAAAEKEVEAAKKAFEASKSVEQAGKEN